MENIVYKIASEISLKGGRAYYVGGCVRDSILGIACNDVDIEVHGITPQVLFEILKNNGRPVAVGKSFGVYKMSGCNLDVAMPRKEHSSGAGHCDFDVEVDPFIGTMEAARRRDFTMNALMRDVLTGEITDHFGGMNDIEKGIIRHIDDATFAEDPLRVLRAAQFASRFLFEVDKSTVEVCSHMDVSHLSAERVEDELKKVLLFGKKPSVFFEVLGQMDGLDVWFSELKRMKGVEQDPVYHPEGDVWNHTMQVLDRAAEYRDKASDAYAFMLLALLHDTGKIVRTDIVNGRIHAYGHEYEDEIQKAFLKRIVHEKSVKQYVVNMTHLHMKPNRMAYTKSAVKKTNHMFDNAVAPRDLVLFADCDRPVMSGNTAYSGDQDFLMSRYEKYLETMEKSYVTGQDLIDMGLQPGKYFSEVLSYAHKLRLAGIDKESAVKQVRSMVSVCRK